MFRRHGQRLALNVVFLSQLVLHGDTALKEYVAVSELLPKKLFHLLVVPTGCSRVLKFIPSTNKSFGRQYQLLYQSVTKACSQWELITITMSQEQRTFLLCDNDRLRSHYLQRCAAHSSINIVPVFSTEQAISILAQGKRRRTRTTLQFFWDTAVHDLILTATILAERRH